jgi:hypothetical protein
MSGNGRDKTRRRRISVDGGEEVDDEESLKMRTTEREHEQ